MRSRLVLCVACILPMVSALNSDVLSPFYEDSFLPNPEFSPDQTDQPSLPVDDMTSFFDTNQLPDESIFENQDGISSPSNENDGWIGTSSWNDVALDDSLELAGCSSSNVLPAIGRSRVKRLDESGICKDSPVTSSSDSVGSVSGKDPDLSGLGEVLPQNPSDMERLLGGVGDEDQNTFCVLYSSFVLPYGVCSAGEVMVAGILSIPPRGTFYHYTLKHFTIGMLVESSITHAASGAELS